MLNSLPRWGKEKTFQQSVTAYHSAREGLSPDDTLAEAVPADLLSQRLSSPNPRRKIIDNIHLHRYGRESQFYALAGVGCQVIGGGFEPTARKPGDLRPSKPV